MSKSRGSILISALWLVIFFAAAIGVVGARVQMQILLAKKFIGKSNYEAVCYSGVSVARQVVLDYFKKIPENLDHANQEPFSENWFGSYPAFQKRELGEGVFFEVSLLDESGKININKVSEKVFLAIYMGDGGLSEDAAQQLAKETIEWRERKVSFAEFGHILVSKRGAGFGSVEELLLLPSMSHDLWQKIKDHLTVYGKDKVNLNTVSKETLKLLGMDESLADRVIEYRKSVACELAYQCKPAFTDLGDLTLKIGTNSEAFSKLQNLYSLWSFEPEIFRIVSKASGNDTRLKEAIMECVIDKKGRILNLKQV